MTSEVQQDGVQPAETVEVSAPAPTKAERADKLVRSHALWAAGMGLIPVPVLDVAGVAGIQYALIGELAKVYDLPFSKERVRALAAAVLGGGLPAVVASGGVSSIAKAVPFVGTILGAAVMPALSAASTIALGRVFTQHFEAGGTLLDFDADKMRAYFVEEFEKAREETSNLVDAAANVVRDRKAEGKAEVAASKAEAAASKSEAAAGRGSAASAAAPSAAR
ncbi:YcjF family protein [Pseudochelatococcus sp. B33]